MQHSEAVFSTMIWWISSRKHLCVWFMKCKVQKHMTGVTEWKGLLEICLPRTPSHQTPQETVDDQGRGKKMTNPLILNERLSQNEMDSAWPQVMASIFFLSQSSDLKYENKLSLECQALFKTKISEGGPEGIVSSQRGEAYNEQLSSLQVSRRSHHTRIQLKIL